MLFIHNFFNLRKHLSFQYPNCCSCSSLTERWRATKHQKSQRVARAWRMKTMRKMTFELQINNILFKSKLARKQAQLTGLIAERRE